MDKYAKSLDLINKELKRLNSEKKKLYIEKKKIEKTLYENMKYNNIEKFQGYKRDKLQPITKDKIIRKKKTEKEKDAIKLFYQIGIPDPENFYKEFQMTQKI